MLLVSGADLLSYGHPLLQDLTQPLVTGGRGIQQPEINTGELPFDLKFPILCTQRET